MKKKIICWDLDETLGGLRNLDPGLKDVGLPWGRRYGIQEVLQRLSADGFVHVIATSAEKKYATTALGLLGLTEHFDAIFDRADMVRTDWGKSYRHIAQHYGLSDQEALDGMVVVGDQMTDKPVDILIVFLEQEYGYQYDAVMVERTIAALLDKGEGSIGKGFEALHKDGEKLEWGSFERRRLQLDGEISITTHYQPRGRDSYTGEADLPSIKLRKIEAFRRDPIHFEIPPDLEI